MTDVLLEMLTINFEHNLIIEHDRFDEYNLQFCKFLNLRGSCFKCFSTFYLENTFFIDIAFSSIQSMDFYNLKLLQQVNHDPIQNILVYDDNIVKIVCF